ARVSRISSAVLVHTSGLGFSFQVSIRARMSFSGAWTDLCTPRRIRLSVSSANHRSTRLSQDAPVEVT
ncbi:hypothetical protein, partial [Streptosporangium fragile]|uniref:hypothetical protein n=1 Tax=Streptosporangium fragile TaxID=46186 RepID=UPI0031E90F8C